MLPHINVCLIWGVRNLSFSKIGKTWVQRTFISEPISYRATTAKANCSFDLSWTSILLWFASPVFRLPSSCFLSVHLPTSMPAILPRLMMILAHRSPGPMWPNIYPVIPGSKKAMATPQPFKFPQRLGTHSSELIDLDSEVFKNTPLLATSPCKISHTPLDSVCNFMPLTFLSNSLCLQSSEKWKHENKPHKVACSVLERSSSAIWQLKVNTLNHACARPRWTL